MQINMVLWGLNTMIVALSGWNNQRWTFYTTVWWLCFKCSFCTFTFQCFFSGGGDGWIRFHVTIAIPEQWERHQVNKSSGDAKHNQVFFFCQPSKVAYGILACMVNQQNTRQQTIPSIRVWVRLRSRTRVKSRARNQPECLCNGMLFTLTLL